MEDLTDRDRRQLTRIAERLDLFTKEQVSLRVLIADLELLLGALEDLDASGRQQLRERWEVLEEVYSVAVGLRGGRLDLDAEALVRQSVTWMAQRVRELLGDATPEGHGRRV